MIQKLQKWHYVMQNKQRKMLFPLSSDQAELLLAFESTNNLNDLAKSMARDTSVISRQLKRLGEEHPELIQKVDSRWRLTHTGRIANELSRQTIAAYNNVIAGRIHRDVGTALPSLSSNVVLLTVGLQQGFDPQWLGLRATNMLTAISKRF